MIAKRLIILNNIINELFYYDLLFAMIERLSLSTFDQNTKIANSYRFDILSSGKDVYSFFLHFRFFKNLIYIR